MGMVRSKIITAMLGFLICIASVLPIFGTQIRQVNSNEFGTVLTGVIYDQGVDTDDDGSFNYLEIGIEVNVTAAGEYNINAYSLIIGEFRRFDVGDSQSVSLDIGTQVVYLRFSGAKIFSLGLNLTNISSISLYDENFNLIGNLRDIPLSRTYFYTEFDAPGASLTGVIYDRGVDTNGDGFFNFLEIGVEVIVTKAGYYNVQAYGLLANGFGYIHIWDSQFAFPEIGTSVIYLRFDGTTIYSSALNPNFVSSISLYSTDNEPLGELYEIPLSRTYSYSEFSGPIQISVGVKAGDWAKYNITASWQSTDPNATEPPQIEAFREIEWVKFEVQSISNTYIMILQTYYYKNGTEQLPPPMSGDMATQFVTGVIPSNLSEGYVIPGTAATINGTVTRSYAGASRAVNYLSYSGSSFGMDMTQTMYWDKATGILCEMLMEISMPTNGYLTTTSTSLKMIETNLWKVATEISCSVSKDTLTEGESIVVSGSLNATLSGKTIVLAYRRPDGSTLNRTVTTGSDGSYSDSYTPDATGTWSVTALWEGDSTHGGATSSSKSFTVTAKPFFETPFGTATVGVGIAAVAVAVVVLVLRKRRP
ncbi:MAG: Ig-like domain-containing protein [Candidatus Bathyarchaeia archaeon]